MRAAYGVALEARLLVERGVGEVNGFAAEVEEGESASQAGYGGLDGRIGAEEIGGAAGSGGGFPGNDFAGEREEVPEEEGGVVGHSCRLLCPLQDSVLIMGRAVLPQPPFRRLSSSHA
jgi:hypothetical protein